MPSQYSEQAKQDALEMLRIGDDISAVHYTTGIPERTLRRWRHALDQRPDGQMAEKSFSPPAGQLPDSDSPDTAEQPTPAPADPSDAATGNDLEDFTYIRDKLLTCARQISRDLQPNAPDISRRALALARLLDRIDRIDSRLPDLAKKEERPPWQDAYDAFMACNPSFEMRQAAIKQTENLDPQAQAEVYERYVTLFQERR